MNTRSYSTCYKFLLVEELVLAFPEQFHYGKCSIIGTLGIDPNLDIYVHNIKVPNIDEKYQLESGSIKLRLLWNCSTVPVYNYPVEIFGEAVLRNRALPDTAMENKLPMNSGDVSREHEATENQTEFWNKISREYEPAVKVHSYRKMSQASKLIECNMKMRICASLSEFMRSSE